MTESRAEMKCVKSDDARVQSHVFVAQEQTSVDDGMERTGHGVRGVRHMPVAHHTP